MTNENEFKEGINWYGWITPFSGYGIVMLEYATAMNELIGDKVSIGWQRGNPNSSEEWKTLTPEQRRLVHEKPFKKERIGIIKTTPDRFGENESEIKIGYTMVENTKIGKDWVDRINAMAACFVPSAYLIDVFRSSGVTVPLYQVRQGINPEKFPFIYREKKPIFRFGTCGWMDQRKNWKEMVQAFSSEFDEDEPVELWIKNTNNTFGFEQATDPRVKIIDKLMTFPEMLDFYGDLDCFLFPSRAEGSGMPPREAMATGLPVILTNWSGLTEICDEKYNYPLTPLAIDLPDYRGDEQPGFQARIDVQELMYWMRYVYEHREEALEKGRLASEWMHKDWNWTKCAQEVINILRENFHYE